MNKLFGFGPKRHLEQLNKKPIAKKTEKKKKKKKEQ